MCYFVDLFGDISYDKYMSDDLICKNQLLGLCEGVQDMGRANCYLVSECIYGGTRICLKYKKRIEYEIIK